MVFWMLDTSRKKGSVTVPKSRIVVAGGVLLVLLMSSTSAFANFSQCDAGNPPVQVLSSNTSNCGGAYINGCCKIRRIAITESD